MAIAMENQCPAFKEQAIKEMVVQVGTSPVVSNPILRHSFSRSIKIMGYGYISKAAASYTLNTSVSIDVFLNTITNNGIDVLTIPASSVRTGFAGNIAPTDSIELAADDVLVIQQSPTGIPGYQFILRYKES